MDKQFWDLLGPTVVIIGTTVALLGETFFPACASFFSQKGDRWVHARRNWFYWSIQIGQNLALGGLVVWVARTVRAHHIGLLSMVSLPLWLDILLGFLLIDVTTYFRHRASHRYSPLWRLHKMHHTDTAVNVTTALRTHPVESVMLIGFSVVQVVVFGVGIETLIVQTPFLLGISLFHHANWRLPRPVERVLGWIIVTPEMHKVHHTPNLPRTDSNFSTVLSVWDRVFGTWMAPDRAIDVTFGLEKPQDPTIKGMWRSAFEP